MSLLLLRLGIQHEISDIYFPFCWALFRIKYNDGAVGGVAQELYSALTSIQMGQFKDELDWVVELKLTVYLQMFPSWSPPIQLVTLKFYSEIRDGINLVIAILFWLLMNGLLHAGDLSHECSPASLLHS